LAIADAGHGALRREEPRLRLGLSILCLPFHDPIRVAEDIALLDNISRGRIDCIGVGSQSEEYETFKIPVRERFGRTWAAIEFIDRFWTEPAQFYFEREYYRYSNVTFTTQPVKNQCRFGSVRSARIKWR